ncbi:hypothetical protein ZOSMA_57G00050 [Zostera marina]|uniref:Uncharacterized protein n=1 Tax=Zostera marina TaxID=29655 RepID=A0A0K9NXM5_ZOSMR|nr:hypothetical protein ZOSMA_57G00050 [Zostera marina]
MLPHIYNDPTAQNHGIATGMIMSSRYPDPRTTRHPIPTAQFDVMIGSHIRLKSIQSVTPQSMLSSEKFTPPSIKEAYC